MIKIFIYGCVTCGINAIYVRRIQKYGLINGIDVLVLNTKYDQDDRIEHAFLLQQMGLKLDSYEPIVVQDGETCRLREWTK